MRKFALAAVLLLLVASVGLVSAERERDEGGWWKAFLGGGKTMRGGATATGIENETERPENEMRRNETRTWTPRNETRMERNGTKDRWSGANLSCIQQAVGKREDSLNTARDAQNNAEHDARIKRRNALFDAWGLNDTKTRKTAIESAWKTYQDSAKNASKTWKTAQDAAWKTYQADARACGISPSVDAGYNKREE